MNTPYDGPFDFGHVVSATRAASPLCREAETCGLPGLQTAIVLKYVDVPPCLSRSDLLTLLRWQAGDISEDEAEQLLGRNALAALYDALAEKGAWPP